MIEDASIALKEGMDAGQRKVLVHALIASQESIWIEKGKHNVRNVLPGFTHH